MKTAIIFSFCVALAFSMTITKEQYNKFASECATEMGFDPVDIVSDKNKTKTPSKIEESCYLACVDKKQGVMKEDGTYDVQMILSYVSTLEMKNKVQIYTDELIKACAPLVKNDPCKLAACFHRMPKDYWEQE